VATSADLTRLHGDVRAEVIQGEIVEQLGASGEHANAQGSLLAAIHGPFHRRASGSEPGGWWIVLSVQVELEVHEVYRPDIVGWRREHAPERLRGFPVKLRPDWVCEVLSPSSAGNDLVKKLRVYHRSQVAHYWIVDPTNKTLMVLRWTPDGYLVALTAGRTDRVRAEPFEAVELFVGALFGDEEEST
jgi:Uma2 family endonuclease